MILDLKGIIQRNSRRQVIEDNGTKIRKKVRVLSEALLILSGIAKDGRNSV